MRRLGSRRGSTVIETAVCLAAVLLLVLGGIQFSLIATARGSVSFAVEQAVRYASVRGAASGSPVDEEAIRRYVREQAPALDPERLRVKTAWLPDHQPGSQVRVEAEYQAPIFLKAAGPSMTLSSSAAMVITQ